MVKLDWILAGLFIVVIVFFMILVANKKQENREIYNDFSEKCLLQNGVVVYDRHNGYGCYGQHINIQS